MRFVALKTEEQQARSMIFRTRDLLVRQRTQLVNALRGHLAEHGIVAAHGLAQVKALATAMRDTHSLHPLVCELGQRYLEHIARRGTEIAELDKARHRRPGSGSTPHDNRRASRLAMLIAFASPRAPQQERDALTTSAASLPLLRPHPLLASSPPKKRVVFAPDDNAGRPPPPPPHGRSIRNPKIPVGPAQPNRASSSRRFPPYEAFGRRPRAQSQRACKGPRPKPSVKRT